MTTSAKSTSKKTRLIYFDYFRAFAILFIVLGHCYNAWQRDTAWESTFVNLVSGNTALFVFISGFFFNHVYFPKYNYWRFIKNKTVNVFMPYLFLSLLFMAIYYWRTGEIFMGQVLQEFFGPQLNQFSLVVMNLLTGRTLWAYWYVPFVMLVFLLSPVFIRFIRIGLKAQLLLTALLFSFSVVVHRPAMEINPFHSLVYYAPYYLLGIIYSLYRERINGYLEERLVGLLVITVLAALTMVWLGQMDNMGKRDLLQWNGIDLMVMQKLTLIPFMLAFTLWLQRFELPFLKIIANMSFAFYFLHQWVLYWMRDTGLLDFEHGIVGVFKIFIFVLICSYFLALLIKQVFKKKSRYLIGW